LVLKHARDAFVSDALIDLEWQALRYRGRPDFKAAVEEYEALIRLFRELGVEPELVPSDGSVSLDSIYVRDAAVTSDGGVILCSMGKDARKPEPAALRAAFAAMDIPVLGSITGDGLLEGGDVVWLDGRTVAVGQGYRTNWEGIQQLRTLLGGAVDEVIAVPLPHWQGPDDVFHLMSILSPIDRDLALVYSPLMPVPFRDALIERGIELIEVPEDEFATMACNVLAAAPRVCVALDGNPRTRSLLEKAGAEVHVYPGLEISWKGAGGPTCLTRPLLRDG
jgi:N-dimethylarginine dimethylaminohydrolase